MMEPIGYQCPTCGNVRLDGPARSLCRGGGEDSVGRPLMPHRPTQVRPVSRITTSAFRAYAEVYRQRAFDPPEDSLSRQNWMWICLQYAKGIEALAEEHERAIDEGRQVEFWAEKNPERQAGKTVTLEDVRK